MFLNKILDCQGYYKPWELSKLIVNNLESDLEYMECWGEHRAEALCPPNSPLRGMRTQSPKCSFATALKWAMCARFFASKWRGITRSHVPVVSFQTISHLIEDSCFSKRAFTIAFFSGVAQHGGRGLGRLGIAGLGWPMRLPLVLLTSVLERTLTVRPVLRSFPLCTLLWCFAIFFITPVFFQYSSADSPSLSANRHWIWITQGYVVCAT